MKSKILSRMYTREFREMLYLIRNLDFVEKVTYPQRDNYIIEGKPIDEIFDSYGEQIEIEEEFSSEDNKKFLSGIWIFSILPRVKDVFKNKNQRIEALRETVKNFSEEKQTLFYQVYWSSVFKKRNIRNALDNMQRFVFLDPLSFEEIQLRHRVLYRTTLNGYDTLSTDEKENLIDEVLKLVKNLAIELNSEVLY